MESTEEDQVDMPVQRTVLLDIPTRLQWENDHGYCGETTIQAFGKFSFREKFSFRAFATTTIMAYL